MALLNKGEVVFEGTPDSLVNTAKGKTWKMNISALEFDTIKDLFPVISTIPVLGGWEIQVVTNDLKGYSGVEVVPNLEDGYVYFMEHLLMQELDNQ